MVDVAYRPTLCTHCADSPCVARSEGAITKRADGIVLIDPEKAAGRRELVDACPHGMIVWSEESSAPQKCTLCAHLLDAGWTEPRCAQACGPGALSFVRESDSAFSARCQAEKIETLHPGAAEHTAVCYTNLHRFDSCFITGSVAVERDGVVDCASGRAVTLWEAGTPGRGAPDPDHLAEGGNAAGRGQPLQTVFTDAFGDFKFDGLEPDSGDYVIEVVSNGHGPQRLTATLGGSVNLGTIMVGGER